ncbi:hypothetical protein VPH35_022953 [Triticum aestivum]
MASGEERPPGLDSASSSFEFSLNYIAAEDSEARFVDEGSPWDSPYSIFKAGPGLGGSSIESARPRKRCREDDESAPCSSEVESDGNNLVVISEHGDATDTPCLRVKQIHVISLLLGSKSPYVYKLFTNGMQESKLKEIALMITDYEDEALPELLHFIYSGIFKTSDPILLLKVMSVVDKFEVVHHMSYCSQLLISLLMTKELALLYLDYDHSVSISNALQHVKIATREFLADKYKNLHMSQAEVLDMSLSGIKAIFSSDNFEVLSEDFYPESVERHRILIKSLVPLVRLSQMSCGKLLSLLHVKTIDFERPTSNELLTWISSLKNAPVFTVWTYQVSTIPLCRTLVFLLVACNLNAQLGIHSFGLYFGVEKEIFVPITIEYEFATRTIPAGNFVFNRRQANTFTSENHLPTGFSKVFNMS